MNETESAISNPKKSTRVLALCDSVAARPGQSLTGFGRVAFNLFSRWKLDMDIWSIGFDGYGYKSLPSNWTLIPGGSQNWNSAERLGAFLRQLANGNYTHVFLLMDPDAISAHNFPAQLRHICREKKIQSLLYYPVDAPLQPPFEIISAVDEAVTFTDYGAHQTEVHLKYRNRAAGQLRVIPHGIDEHFQPVTADEREKFRLEFQVLDKKGRPRPFLNPGDFLIVSVNKNEWRKDPLRCLEILSGLRQAGVPAKLVMRMQPTSMAWGVHLERAAEQLGLTLDKDWAHIGPVSEKHMRSLYGAADLALTTSLGEGWGFMMTEALGCGTPVAVPRNTSLAEIGIRVAGTLSNAVTFLPLENGYVCGYDTRLRQRVDLPAAVLTLKNYFTSGPRRIELTPDIKNWLSWDRIAGEFLKLMKL